LSSLGGARWASLSGHATRSIGGIAYLLICCSLEGGRPESVWVGKDVCSLQLGKQKIIYLLTSKNSSDEQEQGNMKEEDENSFVWI
jgi:hypothetical protein